VPNFVEIGRIAAEIWGRGAGSLSNTMWPGTRPICLASFILIPPTVWPQCTNVGDRQTDRTDNGPLAQGEPFYKRSPKNVFGTMFRSSTFAGSNCYACKTKPSCFEVNNDRCVHPFLAAILVLLLMLFSERERELTFTFAICCRPSVCLSVVCLSSATLVHPRLWRSSQGNPSVGGVKPKWGSKI